MNLRIRDLREDNDLKQKDLAEYLVCDQSLYSKYERGERPLPLEYAEKLADYYGVSVDYLLSGKESPARFTNITTVVRRRVPLLGEIACGEPIYADEQHEYSVPLGSDCEADFVLRAKGDSMIGAHIHDGDLVFFRRCETVDNGKIAIVIIGDEATLKRVYYTPEKQQLILMPENPAFRPLVYVGAELEQVRIMGEALFVQSLLH